MSLVEVLIAVSLLQTSVAADAGVGSSGDYNVSMEVETSHVRWARPYSGGRIKALILTNVYQQREIVELAQRVGLEVQTVSFSMAGYRRPIDRTLRSLEDARARLLKYLKENDYDVMVIGGLGYQREFDQPVRDEIVKKVKGGMGLVYVTPNGLDEAMQQVIPLKGDVDVKKESVGCVWAKAKGHFISNGFDFRIFPSSGLHPYTADDSEIIVESTDGHPLIAVSSHGKGRVIAMGYDALMQYGMISHQGAGLTPQLATSNTGYDYPQFQPERELEYAYWEYHFALLGKCVIWAAQKENSLDLTAFTWANDGKRLDLTILNRGKSVQGKCSFVFRNKYSEITGRKETDVVIGEGETPVTVPLDVLTMHGNNYCELVVSDEEGRCLTWGVAYLKLEKPKHIDRVELTRAAYRAGSAIVGQVYVFGPGPDKPYDLACELYDLNGRLVDSWTTKYTYSYPGMDMQSFVFSTKRCVDEGGVVVVRLSKDGVPWDVVRKRVVIWTPFDRDEFYYSGWSGPFATYYLKEVQMNRLRQIGFRVANVQALESTFSIPEDVALWRKRGWKMMTCYTLRPAAQNTGYYQRYVKTKDKSVLVRIPCFSNPGYIARSKADFATAATQMVEYGGALNYGAGDEITLRQHLCCCPHCMKRYRALLREEYGSLEELNSEWGTNYSSFDEILPETLEEAHERGNYASWALWRQSMEAGLVEFFRTMDAVVKSIDPGAGIHTSGTIGDSINYGVDYWELSKVIDFKGYNEWWLVGELLRSFQTTLNQPYAYSWGHIWLDVLQGAYGGIGSCPMVKLELWPDLTLTNSGLGKKKFMDEMVRPGLVRFMNNSVRDNTRIGLHYSRLSRFAARAMDPERGEHPEWEYNVESWSVALNTLGLQSDMLSFHDLEAGKLAKKDYDVFILPTSYALRPGEVKAIREYVNNGGVVIADGRCGEFNEHLICNKSQPLDDLFGVKSSKKLVPSRTTIAPWGAEVEVFDAGLKAAGATKLFRAEEPIAFVKRSGTGKAIYLNFKIEPYIYEPKSKERTILHYATPYYLKLKGPAIAAEDKRLEVQHALIAEILQQAGKEPDIRARNADGSFLLSKLVRYQAGDASLLAFLACSRGGNDVEITLDRKYHVRDVLSKRYLGYVDRIPTSLRPGQDLPGSVYFVTHARLYSLMPEKADEVVFTAPEKVQAGDEVRFSISVSLRLAGMTTVYLTVRGPDGRRLPHYDQSVFVRYGEKAVTGVVKLALNDKPGKWRIMARDMLSGAEREHTLLVEP